MRVFSCIFFYKGFDMQTFLLLERLRISFELSVPVGGSDTWMFCFNCVIFAANFEISFLWIWNG